MIFSGDGMDCDWMLWPEKLAVCLTLREGTVDFGVEEEESAVMCSL